MGRAEERARLKQQKKQFKNQGMSDKHYQDFLNKVNEKYYYDMVEEAFKDVYTVFYDELIKVMRENRISEERTKKILADAMEETRKHSFKFKGKEV